jgi:hypothetical protein
MNVLCIRYLLSIITLKINLELDPVENLTSRADSATQEANYTKNSQLSICGT